MATRTIVKIDGQRIKEIRIMRGVRQCDVADKAGIARSFLSNIEAGRRRVMSRETATALCYALGNVDQRSIRATPNGTRNGSL